MVVFSVALLRPPVVRVYVIEESKGSPQFFQLCGVASCARSHQFVHGSAQDVTERKAFHIAPQFCTLRFETISTLRARQHAHSALRDPAPQLSPPSRRTPPHVSAASASGWGAAAATGRNPFQSAASAAKRQGIPEIAKLTGTPQWPATALTSKLPTGVVPMKTIAYTLMTRPRSSLGLESCTRVLAEAENVLMKKPVRAISTSTSCTDAAMATLASSTPKAAAIVTRRRFVGMPPRFASSSAPMSAPAPSAELRRPKILRPRCSTPLASSGKRMLKLKPNMPHTAMMRNVVS